MESSSVTETAGSDASEQNDICEKLLKMEEPDKIWYISSWLWTVLHDAATLHHAILRGLPKTKIVELYQRVESQHPLIILSDRTNRVFTLARGVAEISYWPNAGFANNAHEATAISVYALLTHIRHAGGLAETGQVDWKSARFGKIRAHLRQLPDFPESRLARGMEGERIVALERWQSKPAERTQVPLKPRWDQDRRELWFGGCLCKRYRQPAKNQETILAAFEEDGWPARIDDPLPGTAEGDPGQRLADAVRALNENKGCIDFEKDGTSAGVLWKIRVSRES
jgi:hypothetical protein